MVSVLVKMTNSNMDVIYSDMITKVQQVRQQYNNVHCVQALVVFPLCVHSQAFFSGPVKVSEPGSLSWSLYYENTDLCS